MKRISIIVALVCFAGFAARVASSEAKSESEAKQTIFMGEGIDLACYMTSGHNSPKCAANCVEKKGHPAGFLVKDGDKSTLYVVISNCDQSEAELFHSKWGKPLKVTGATSVKDGLQALLVEKVEIAE